ncbi:calphotin-like [Astatotilapia calliptera]|uniref:calphotin-like n=1 Tax=Astatotilapia calliptera TaxID=8154 RepID=UPI000E3FD9FC|nr:calphotin-like [Astatotilapia calliptera]
MGPADSRTVSQEELLAQLWKYCRSIIQAADPHQRHMQVVFFDSFLSSITSSVSFLDIKRLISIITTLRESSCFELFGLGCPGEEDMATSLGALAAYFFFHRLIASPPSLAARLLDPPLRGKRFTRPLHLTTSPLTSAAPAESADQGPAAQTHTAALLSGRLVEPQPDTLAPASLKKRRLRRRRASPQSDSKTFQQPAVVSHIDNSSSFTSSVYSRDCVKANLVALPAAQPVAVAQPAAQPVAVAQPAAQPVAVAQPAAQPVAVAQPAAQPVAVAQPAAQPVAVAQPAAQPVAVAQPAAQPVAVAQPAAQPVAVAQPAAQPVAVAQPVAQPVAVAQPVQSASRLHPQLEADMPAGTTLPLCHPPVVSTSLSSLPRVAAAPLSPPPFAATSPPASHQTAATAELSTSPSTSPARPSSSPPAASASPSSPPDQRPSIPASQPEERLSEREEPASPAVELSEPEELSMPERELSELE